MKYYWNEKKGITLIALVVTIIVLLVLAGISISMLTGQNGILNRTAEAKEKTAKTEKKENIILDEYGKMIDKYASNLPSTEDTMPYLPDIMKFERLAKTDLESGLVILEKETGSEYVWVEVPKTKAVYQTAGMDIINFTDEECTKIENDLQTYTADYRNGTSFSDTYSEDETKGWFDNKEQYNELKNKMLKSVYQNGGFWVGRYEAGVEKNRISPEEITVLPVSKENLYPYTYVTRAQAKVLAESVESGNYTSSLMFGIQWDLILKYIETKKSTSQVNLKSDSTTIGNYYNSELLLNRGKFARRMNILNWAEFNSNDESELVTECKKKGQVESSNGVLLTTGATELTKLQNIYDMAGNVWEWTLERQPDISYPCTIRGGVFDQSGTDYTICHRGSLSISHSGQSVGFRVSIY